MRSLWTLEDILNREWSEDIIRELCDADRKENYGS